MCCEMLNRNTVSRSNNTILSQSNSSNVGKIRICSAIFTCGEIGDKQVPRAPQLMELVDGTPDNQKILTTSQVIKLDDFQLFSIVSP